MFLFKYKISVYTLSIYISYINICENILIWQSWDQTLLHLANKILIDMIKLYFLSIMQFERVTKKFYCLNYHCDSKALNMRGIIGFDWLFPKFIASNLLRFGTEMNRAKVLRMH